MPAKVDIFKDGVKLGQLDIILTDIKNKVSKEEDLAERASALVFTLETLKDEFVTQNSKKTALFQRQREQLNVLDKEIYCLMKDMKKRNLDF